LSIAELFDFARRERGLVYVTIGNTGSAVFGALFWFILAMFLEVGDYGEVNYHIASASVPAAIGLLGLDTTVTTYLAKGDEEIMYESSFLILLSSIVLSAVTVGFNWLSPLIIMSTMFFRMSIAEILGRKRYIEYASVKVAYRLVQIGSAFFSTSASGYWEFWSDMFWDRQSAATGS
jgi:O-antigen/teichoic acid export membrane protein